MQTASDIRPNFIPFATIPNEVRQVVVGVSVMNRSQETTKSGIIIRFLPSLFKRCAKKGDRHNFETTSPENDSGGKHFYQPRFGLMI